MIIAIDTETNGLDAQQFIAGGLLKESGTFKLFKHKENMWNYIKELAYTCRRSKSILNVYAHNHEYDFYGYANLEDNGIKIYSTQPFIVSYLDKDGKELIKFLDTMSFYRMSLAKVGDIIGLPKLDMPNMLYDDNSTLEEAKNAFYKDNTNINYLKRDCEIVLQAILNIKKLCKNNNLTIRRLITINQVAIQNLMNEMVTQDIKGFWYDSKKKQVQYSRYNSIIHGSYRGGRVEAFKTGSFNRCTYIDKNSLYPYSATVMRFPNMKSETLIRQPLKRIDQYDLLSKIGISKALLINEKNDIGLLPIRTTTSNYYPKKKKLLLGRYTHTELLKAINRGYKLIDIEYSVVYEDTINPLTRIFNDMYIKRIYENDTFMKYFWKMMMNSAIGKFGQRNHDNRYYIIDSVEKVYEYMKKNYDVVRGINLSYMYKKEISTKRKKSYYNPLLPSLINAYARCYMYDCFEKIGLNNLIYTDTDSAIFTGELPSLSYDNTLYGWKVVNENTNCIIWGKKTYSIGNDIKIGGFRKKDITLKDFEKGYVESKKMRTMHNNNDLTKVGTFFSEKRDLHLQKEKLIEWNELLESEKIYVDYDINNIGFFIKNIERYI